MTDADFRAGYPTPCAGIPNHSPGESPVSKKENPPLPGTGGISKLCNTNHGDAIWLISQHPRRPVFPFC